MKKVIISLGVLSTLLFANNWQNKVGEESYSHQKRISILQEAEKCIQNAKTDEEYKQCESIEKQGRKTHKSNMKERRRGMKSKNLKEIKSKILSKIDERMSKLESSKSCVLNASSREDLRNCRPKRKNNKNKKFNPNNRNSERSISNQNRMEMPPMPPQM